MKTRPAQDVSHRLQDPTYDQFHFASSAARDPVDQPERIRRENEDVPNTYTFWRGRVALYAILKALGIGRGDSVLIPGFTCFAVPAAVAFAGAQPLYVDIDRNTFNISPASIEATLAQDPRQNVKAIIIQHTFGLPAELDAIIYRARQQGIATIEDCAHAWGSRYQTKAGGWIEVGTLGEAAFFSSQWTKPISTGLGGWAKVNDPSLEESLRQFYERECVNPSLSEAVLLAGQVAIRNVLSASWAHWKAKSIYQFLYRRGLTIGTSTSDELRGKMPRYYAKRMSRFQESLLKKKLSDFSLQIKRRRLKQSYDVALRSAGLPIFDAPANTDAVLLRYPVRMENKKRVLEEAKHRGIELGDWYSHPIDAPEGLDARAFGYHGGMCPEGERAAAEVVNLPMHSRVGEAAVHRAVDFLKEVA